MWIPICAVITMLFMLSGCGQTITVKETKLNGDTVETKYSESAYLASQNTTIMTTLGDPKDACDTDIPESFKDWSAAGQAGYTRALEMCNIRSMVGLALGLPTTAHGQIAAQNTKAIMAIEAAETQKTKSMWSFGTAATIGYFSLGAVEAAFGAAGATYAIGDVQMRDSN